MLRLEPRPTAPLWIIVATPLFAVSLTLVVAGIIFASAGIDPVLALKVYFVYPLADRYGVAELFVKATPILLCALGLMFCFRAGVWNIGAEGQLTIGAVTGAWVALSWPELPKGILLPLVIVAGISGGMVWALIPALLRTRFGANEILTSLMLVYVAQLFLSAMVFGPLRDPDGFNFPKSKAIAETATLPIILSDTRLHLGLVFALMLAVLAYVLRTRHVFGFGVRVTGYAPKAAVLGGFQARLIIVSVLLLSGAAAGLAGIGEVIGPIGQLNENVSPGYGFTAIIVAFLGRQHPVGIVLASLLLALSFLGGELAQIMLKVPNAVTGVFQGVLLFIILGCDMLVNYRLRWQPGTPVLA